MSTQTSSNSKLEYQDKYCSSCGESIVAAAYTCPKCGVKVIRSASEGRSKLIAALLAFFLGGFGIHKFYLRETLVGVFYILFFWTGVPLLFSFVEMIIYLAVSNEYFDGRYNKPDGSLPDFSWIHFLLFSFCVIVAALVQLLFFGLVILALII